MNKQQLIEYLEEDAQKLYVHAQTCKSRTDLLMAERKGVIYAISIIRTHLETLRPKGEYK